MSNPPWSVHTTSCRSPLSLTNVFPFPPSPLGESKLSLTFYTSCKTRPSVPSPTHLTSARVNIGSIYMIIAQTTPKMTNYFQKPNVTPLRSYPFRTTGACKKQVLCKAQCTAIKMGVILPQECAVQLGRFQMLPYCWMISHKNSHSCKQQATDPSQE